MRGIRIRFGWRTWLLTLTVLVWLIAIWPPASSLYDLTGEQNRVAQIRGVLHWLNTAVRPQPELAPEKVRNLEYISPFGVNTFLEQEVEAEKRERSLQLIWEAGFRFVRQEYPWEDIEIHGKGDFIDRRNVAEGIDAWAKYDHIADSADKRGIEIIARLGNPPSWTRALTNTIGTYAPPDSFEDFGDFAEAVADRYGQITYFQIWNEPNGNEEWGKQEVNPEAYTELLCLAYDRIKEANPDAVVLAAALTPTLAMDGRNMNDLIFLQRMYDAGAGACFDAMSAQGYGLWSGPTDQRLRPTVINFPHQLFVRDIMVRNGDADKTIWISEMGWNSVPEAIPANFGRVTEEQQADYLVEAYQRAQTDWPWLGVLNTWFFKRPGDSERNQSWYYFRLLEPDFSPLPVYHAIAEYANDGQAGEERPDWISRWDRVRPVLFVSSTAILFFALLQALAPAEQDTGTKTASSPNDE
jgi:hypothetical protein